MKDELLLEDLEKIASSHSDTEYAKLLQQQKVQLSSSFAKPGMLYLMTHALCSSCNEKALRLSICKRRYRGVA